MKLTSDLSWGNGIRLVPDHVQWQALVSPSDSAASACLHFVYLLYKLFKSTLDCHCISSLA